MRLLGNIIWFTFGGVFIALEYFVASFLLCLTIVGIPFGIQTFKLGLLALWPFGKTIKEKENTSGCLSIFMNVWWIIFGGLAICISHLFMGVLFSITIVGLPFGRQHFKLAGLALVPFGKEIIF
jgi:uncharacterized membrane protein YccF (DUF307 family)